MGVWWQSNVSCIECALLISGPWYKHGPIVPSLIHCKIDGLSSNFRTCIFYPNLTKRNFSVLIFDNLQELCSKSLSVLHLLADDQQQNIKVELLWVLITL